MEKQNGYSKLFIDLTSMEIETNENTIENPFTYLINYIAKLADTSIPINFKQTLTYQKSLKLDSDFAYDCFLVEITNLDDKKTEYLNEIINFLFEQYDMSVNSNLTITICIREIFTKICLSHFNMYINSYNRKRLLRWYPLKEPIKSFILKKVPEDKWFQNRVYEALKGTYISNDTNFSSFKALFEGKYVENKINWIDKKSSLLYFIKSLLSSQVIVNPKNKHWEIVSEFFLIEKEAIKRDELINKKETTNKTKRKLIDKIIKALLHQNS